MRASSTTTATGEVLISVSSEARARRSSRCRRALAMTSAACAAKRDSVSSSSLLKVSPASLLAA